MPGEVLPVDPAAFAGYRSSYRCLAWWFSREGTVLPDDLCGDDRPEQTARLYDDLRAWLAGGRG